MNKAFNFYWRKLHQRTIMKFYVFDSIKIFENVKSISLWGEQIAEVIENIVGHV